MCADDVAAVPAAVASPAASAVPAPEPECLTWSVLETAKVAGCTDEVVYEGIHSGRLAAARLGRSLRVLKSAVPLWLEEEARLFASNLPGVR